MLIVLILLGLNEALLSRNNKYANALARMGANQANDFFLFKSPPMDILETLSSDGNGLYLTRFCSEVVLAL